MFFILVAPLIFIFSIFSKFLNNSSKCPNSNSNVLAAFLPIPGTPGILSEGSPSKAYISATKSGPNPSYLSFTFPGSYILISPYPEYIRTFV